jgi:hypothetical protein
MQRDEEDEKHGEVIEHLRYENLLVYTPPSSGCLIDSRQFKSLNFSSNTYSLGDTMQIIMNSGADAIYGPACYLRLELTQTILAAQTPANFGFGSVMNLLQNMRLLHRSGNPLEEILNVNIVSQLKRLYGLSPEDREKLDGMLAVYQPMVSDGTFANALGHVAGTPVLSDAYSPDGGSRNFLPVSITEAAAAGARPTVAGAYKYVFTIPLSMISGVFANKEQMIPPSLLAGAKMEIDVNNGVIALANYTAFNGAGGSITALKPTIVYDANVLYSSVNKQLLMEQAREPDSGLAFVYKTWFTTGNIYAADASLDVSQSASLCESIAVAVRSNAAIAGGSDSFKFLAPYQTYQFRIGSHYLPLQPIKLPGATYATALLAGNDGREVYEQALTAWNAGVEQFHKSSGGGSATPFQPDRWLPVVSYIPDVATLIAAPANLAFTNGGACYAASLEKSPCGLMFSGQSTNNSRILNVQFTGQPTVVAPVGGPPAITADMLGPFQVTACLEYIRSARVSGDNCIVDR